MPWLREDDSELLNPKIGKLTDSEYRALHALRQFCARARRDGQFALADLPFSAYLTRTTPKVVTRQQLDTFVRLGLVEAAGDDYTIHDWQDYNPKDPTAAERQARYRARTRGNGPLDEDDIPFAPPGSREQGTNPRAQGTNPRAQGTNPKALGTNPRAQGTNPKAQGTPRKRRGLSEDDFKRLREEL